MPLWRRWIGQGIGLQIGSSLDWSSIFRCYWQFHRFWNENQSYAWICMSKIGYRYWWSFAANITKTEIFGYEYEITIRILFSWSLFYFISFCERMKLYSSYSHPELFLDWCQYSCQQERDREKQPNKQTDCFILILAAFFWFQFAILEIWIHLNFFFSSSTFTLSVWSDSNDKQHQNYTLKNRVPRNTLVWLAIDMFICGSIARFTFNIIYSNIHKFFYTNHFELYCQWNKNPENGTHHSTERNIFISFF